MTGPAIVGETPAFPPRRVVQRRLRALMLATAVLDTCALVAAYLIVESATSRWPEVEPLGRLSFLATVPGWLAAILGAGLYNNRKVAAASEEARRLLQAITVSVVGVLITAFLLEADLGRRQLVGLAVIAAGLLAVVRIVIRIVTHRLQSQAFIGTRTLIVGTNEEARALRRSLDRQAWRGFQVEAFVDLSSGGFSTIDGTPVIGGIETLARTVSDLDVGVVIVAGSAVAPDQLVVVNQVLEPLDVDVKVSPALPQVAASRFTVEPIDGLALFALKKQRFTRRQAFLKRSFDLAGAVALLLLTAPAIAVVALLVRVTSGRPTLFRQVRAGEQGRPFVMLKFRSMVPDAELLLDDLRPANEADGLLFAMEDDPRVTPVGRFIRRWGLDELPQLFNVVRGDMSLVGPRPALLSEADAYNERVRGRLRVRPGLTGLWQVNGRHDVPFDDYVRFDLFYVENWTLGLDIYIALRTLPALLTRGAR